MSAKRKWITGALVVVFAGAVLSAEEDLDFFEYLADFEGDGELFDPVDLELAMGSSAELQTDSQKVKSSSGSKGKHVPANKKSEEGTNNEN